MTRRRERVLLTAIVASVLGTPGPGWSQCEIGTLAPGDGRPEQQFGGRVALDGSLALVPAETDDQNGHASGAAYVFRWTGDAWSQEQKLTPADPSPEDRFGFAVAIDGSTALVGSWGDDDKGESAGAAYVFRREGSGWVQTQKLTAADPSPFAVFGATVALDGDTAMIAAWDDNENGVNAGSVYVFRYDGKTWREEQKITPDDARPDSNFGWSIGLRGDVMIVGVPLDDDLGNRAGAAYVFRRDGKSWSQEQKLMHPQGEPLDFFGDSVAIAGSVAVVGAWGDDAEESSAGSAHVFRHADGAWKVEQMLTAGDAAPLAGLGTAVAIDGNVVVCGASGDLELAGSAYVFRHDGQIWNEAAKLTAADGAPGDRFGESVALDESVVLVSARFHAENGANSGAVFAFDHLACVCVADVDGNGEVGFGDILAVLDAWGDAGGPADLDGSGTVGDGDLNVVLSEWGPCG